MPSCHTPSKMPKRGVIASSPTPAISPKRKFNTTNYDSSWDKRFRRRCRKACNRCHARKVRCDADRNPGATCNNCRLDNTECVINQDFKKNGIDEGISPASLGPQLEQCGVIFCSARREQSLPGDAGDYQYALLYSDPFYTQPNNQAECNNVPLEDLEESAALASEASRNFQTSYLDNRSFESSTRSTSVHAATGLPSYIRSFVTRLTVDDIEFLKSKDVFELPDEQLRNELLRSFVEYVYPFMPILNLEAFLRPMQKGDGSETISLFVLQAVLFTASTVIDMRFINAAGYHDRRSLRKKLFAKARLLYDFDTETNGLDLLQGVLLLTYWFESPKDQKHTWHWIGIGLSLAVSLGLHRNLEQSSLQPDQRGLYKRLWWCCFMRDKLSALALRRPIRIKEEEYDVPTLDPDDFENQSLPSDFLAMLGHPVTVSEPFVRTELARLCIEQANLCRFIGRILSSQSHSAETIGSPRIGLFTSPSARETSQCVCLDSALEDWHRLFDNESHQGLCNNMIDADVLRQHHFLLDMIYFTAVITLHLPQLLSASTQTTSIGRHLEVYSRKRVKAAASDITKTAMCLKEQGLTRFLPPPGVTVILPAVIVYLLDTNSTDLQIREDALRSINQCCQVLQQLRSMYASADYTMLYIQRALRKTKADMRPRHISTHIDNLDTCVHAHLGQVPACIDTLTPPPEVSDSGPKTFDSMPPSSPSQWINFAAAAASPTEAATSGSTVQQSLDCSGDKVERSMSWDDMELRLQDDFNALFDVV